MSYPHARASLALGLEPPDDVAIAVHYVDPFRSLPESHSILSGTGHDGISQQLEPSLSVGPKMEVPTAFAFEPMVPSPKTL